MSGSNQDLVLIKELEHILDSCTLELTPVDEVWPNLYIGNVWVPYVGVERLFAAMSSTREKWASWSKPVQLHLNIIPWPVLFLFPIFALFFVSVSGPLRRIERNCRNLASLMSWMPRTPSRAASGTRAFTGTPASTLASRPRIQTGSISVSTWKQRLTSYTKGWRAKMVQHCNVTPRRLTFSCFLSLILHPAPQGRCWCIASWAWAAPPLWSWLISCCGSVSVSERPWGLSSRSEPFIQTGISCRSSSRWMNSWHTNGGCVLFSDTKTITKRTDNICHSFSTVVYFSCTTYECSSNSVVIVVYVRVLFLRGFFSIFKLYPKHNPVVVWQVYKLCKYSFMMLFWIYVKKCCDISFI